MHFRPFAQAPSFSAARFGARPKAQREVQGSQRKPVPHRTAPIPVPLPRYPLHSPAQSAKVDYENSFTFLNNQLRLL
ncbi:hypothetical protein FHETE_11390, partial [Fusarium heterosporum]